MRFLTDATSCLSWPGTTAAAMDNGQDWQTVNRRKPVQPNFAQRLCSAAPTKKRFILLCSKKELASVAAVRSVPRRDILSAFVGRLHIDTSEQDFTDY